jgi:hypothetical protein
MVFKVALRSWCKRRGINHKDFSDEELMEMRSKYKELGYNVCLSKKVDGGLSE